MSKRKLKDEALLLYNNGKKAYETAKTDEALSELSKAYNMYKHSEDYPILADILRILGEILFNKGHLIESRNHYKKAYSAFKSYSNIVGMADCYDQIALSFLIQSEYSYASEYQQKALKLREGTADKKGLARGKKNLAVIIYRSENDGEKALRLLDDAMELAKKGRDPQLVINIALDKSKILNKLGLLEESMKNSILARRFSKKYSIKLPDEHEKDFCDLLLNLGFRKYDEDNLEDALKYLRNAVLILKKKNDPIIEKVELTIEKIELKLKD